jgi:hypothetical protein
MNDFIEIYDNVFDQDWCNSVIEIYDELENCGFGWMRSDNPDDDAIYREGSNISNASMIDEISTLDFKDFGRYTSEFMTKFTQDVLPLYEKKYSILKSHREYGIWQNKMQKIKIGEGFHGWHCETQNRQSSNRILAYILYLNDVEDGGETEFLYQHKRLKSKQGTISLFPAYFTHTHRGNPPLSNTKYIINGWVEY